MSTDRPILPGGPEELLPLGDVAVTLVAELDRATLPFLDVARWTHGSVVRLPSSAGETITIRIGNVSLATGEVLVVDGALAVRVSDLAAVPETAAQDA